MPVVNRQHLHVASFLRYDCTVMNVPRIAIDQPGWVWRAALGVAAFVVALPLILLVMLAILAATAVFAVLALASTLAGRVRSLFGRSDGRENVRIVARQP
ncbi:MAG TPA: hypothetical protein VFX76_15400 [Roseiflexaceae bacterium]|nr:hypothetical protein [Roseiflexaceae bacterium]